MDIAPLALSAVSAGLIVGALIWLYRGQRIAALRAENESLRGAVTADQTARAELENVKGRLESAQRDSSELVDARKRIFDLGRESAGLRAELEKANQAHAEQVGQLTSLRQDVQDQFKLLAGDVLRTANDDFTKRAEGIFKAQKESTAAEIDKRSKDISDLIKPLSDSLKAYEIALGEIEKARAEGYGGIDQAIKTLTAQNNDVKAVTSNLVNALRQSPKTRGRWGEETLKRVMEMSGMVDRCDFDTEKRFKFDDETLQPDVIINLSGGRTIIVDAKAPVSAYIDALKATGEEEREALLKQHAAQLRERLTNLSSKAYWEKISGSTDCVVMFVPGENFVSAAFERDTNLFEDSISKRVLICTPTTFIALVKALSYGWRQERLAANALEVQKLGRELHARLSTMIGYVSAVGAHLERGVAAYNKLVGSLESRVLPQARRFNELGVEGTAAGFDELSPIDTATRSLDLEFPALPGFGEEETQADA